DCYVAGAYDGTELVGGSVGFIGGPQRDVLHSHITGVARSRTSAGIGYALKQHQRAWAGERGLTAISWTFDPLIARNAHFNLHRLGGRIVEYLVDFYGPMIDGLNLGQPSDRAFVRWELAAPAAAPECPEPVAALIIGPDGGPVHQPELIATTPVELIIPADIENLRRTDPEAALEWRLALRAALVPLLTDGWTVDGFRRSGGYLVTPPTWKEDHEDR
ncbi:MAG: GNAT family N-acetyltransferase, partial [Microlunatus sp.]|nr:GNAT family N-acetyltransferase [Microlunatus sp.]